MDIEKEILYRFFNGDATPEEQEQVRTYLEDSPANWKEYLRERRLFDAIILKNSTIVSQKQRKRKLQIRSIVMECMKVAALLVIAFTTAYFWFDKSGDAAATSVVSTLQGQMANVTLPDGTRVWLNSNTTLEYPTSFADGKRNVQIAGEAYFEVTRDEARPFVVQTTRTQVEVLGTKFYVEDYSNSDRVETALIEGSVLVTSGNSTLKLKPSFKAVLRNGQMVVEKIADFDTYRWREGLICFKSKPFAEILREFEKYYGMKIVIANDKVSNPALTGKFRLADGLEYALRVLQRDVKFTYTRDDDKNMITIH